jgi:hypothetical protein
MKSFKTLLSLLVSLPVVANARSIPDNLQSFYDTVKVGCGYQGASICINHPCV